DKPELLTSLGKQLNILPDEPAQQCLYIADDGVQVDNGRLQDLLTAEGQELSGQRGPSLPTLFDLFSVSPKPGVGRAIPQEKFTMPEYCGQKVVKVMSYSSREPPYGLHFLGLAELFLQTLTIGNVLHENQELDRAFIAVKEPYGSRVSPDRGTILSQVALLDIEKLRSAGGNRFQQRLGLLTIFRVGHL